MTIVALFGVIIIAAQTLLAAHFHDYDDTHVHVDHGLHHEHTHDQDDVPPAQECDICLLATATNTDAGPAPHSAAAEYLREYSQQAFLAARPRGSKRVTHSGTSPRGPPAF